MSKSRIEIDWRRALIPISLAIMFLMVFYFKTPLWALALFMLWMPIYYLAYPWYLRKRWLNFEREFAFHFQQRNFKTLLQFYRDNWFLRKFGPRAEMLTKLSLIYSGMEKYREAEQVLEQAIELTPSTHRDRLYYNLANVKYELGKYDEAEQMYKALNRGTPFGQTVRVQLALIDLQRGRSVAAAKKTLQTELENSTGVLKARITDALSRA